ncbi:MAG: hypothetical protein ACKV2T_31725 [Kofleriaceae bacterium]
MRVAVALAVFACSGEPRAPTSPSGSPSERASVAHDAPPIDAPPATGARPANNDAPAATAAPADAQPIEVDLPGAIRAALAELRTRGYGDAARVIEARMAQSKPKMKLTAQDGLGAANALVDLDREIRDALLALHAVMPRSTVELARAVRERGVPVGEAEAIARYLVRVVDALAFERLATFDDNHSHVTGRDWPDIDYTGEGMTWQGQKADWVPKGVTSFQRAAFIHAYFVGAERLPHWKRVYRPRGPKKMSDVAPP